MTNTPDASATPVGDLLDEPSADILGRTANATDEMLLQYQLGLNLDWMADAATLAATASQQIFQLIDTTRHGIANADELRTSLEPSINEALRRVRGRLRIPNGSSVIPERQMRALEVSKAIFQSLDKKIFDDMTRHATLHIVNPPNPFNLSQFEILIDNVKVAAHGKFSIIIDTRNTFWVEAPPLNDPAAFANALKGMTLEQAGIRIVNSPLRHDERIPANMAYYLATQSVVEMQRRDRLPGTPNNTQNISLMDVQRMLREQHQYNRILRDGSDNSGSAAFASSILMRYKDIASVLGGPGEKSEVSRKLEEAKSKRDILALIEKLGSLSWPSTKHTWAENTDIVSKQAAELGKIVIGAAGVRIDMGYGLIYDLNIGGVIDKNQAAIAVQWVQEQVRNANAEIAEYQKTLGALQSVAQKVMNITHDASKTDLTKMFTYTGDKITGVDETQFKPNISISTYLDEVRNLSDLNLLGADHTQEITKLEQQIKDIDAGKRTALTGDAAQHAVIAKYFEQYHHCSPSEAQQAAQYLRSQMLLDRQTATMTDQIADELVPEVRGRWRAVGDVIANTFKQGTLNIFDGATDRRMLANIALACGIRQRYIPERAARDFRDWEGATYPQLLTAYHTMQAFIEKKDPAKVRLPKTQRVIDEMKRIIAAITGKHASLLLRDFGAAQNITGEQAEAIKKDPTKPEHMRMILEMLQGDPPAGYAKRIQDAAKKVNGRHERGWRIAKTVLGTGWKVGKGGAVLGSQYVIAKPTKAAYGAVAGGVKKTANTAKGNKGTLATFALASLAGGPLVGGLAALAYKAVSGEKSKSTSYATAA